MFHLKSKYSIAFPCHLTSAIESLLLIAYTCRIFNTPVIKFVVGKEEKEMMMHTVLVAEQSRALRSLVNGPMKEAQNNTVIWKDVNEQTFALFAEFVYTGGYTLPTIGENQATESSAKFHPLTDRIITEKPEQSSRKRKASSLEVVPQSKQTKYEPPSTSAPPLTPKHLLRGATDEYPSNDATLVHARLYVLADKYGITELKHVAYEKLCDALYEPYPYRETGYRELMVLIRYVFENTPCRQPKDDLRMLVTYYVAYENQRKIARSKECLDLIEECGAFARDLMWMILTILVERD